MNIATLALIGSLLAGSDCITGTASQYDPGVMERNIRNRQAGLTAIDLPMVLPDADGYAAAMRCSDIGQIWTVIYKDTSERILITDCSGDGATTRWMKRGNILMEIDYQTAKRWGVVGRGAKVTVCKSESNK